MTIGNIAGSNTTNISRIGVLAVSLAALTLAGCQGSQRFASLEAPSRGTVAEPLPPAPAGTVTAGQLPPAQPGAFPDAPAPAQGTQPPGQQMAAANASPVTTGAVAGVWNASVSGQGCRIATPQTRFGSGYRAGPLRCPAPLDGVRSWNVEGTQLALYDQNGSVLARLYSSGGERFDGQTVSGQPVSLSR